MGSVEIRNRFRKSASALSVVSDIYKYNSECGALINAEWRGLGGEDRELRSRGDAAGQD